MCNMSEVMYADRSSSHDRAGVRAGAAARPALLGAGRHEHGALLRAQVLPGAGRVSEREGRGPGRQEEGKYLDHIYV